MKCEDGIWIYPCPFQQSIVESAQRVLAWDLHAFDRWLFDGSQWSKYTCVRRRLIELRSVLATQHPKATQQIAGDFLVIQHCLGSWQIARAGIRANCQIGQVLRDAQMCSKTARKLLRGSNEIRAGSWAPK